MIRLPIILLLIIGFNFGFTFFFIYPVVLCPTYFLPTFFEVFCWYQSNHPPVIDAIENKSVFLNQEISFWITATDPDPSAFNPSVNQMVAFFLQEGPTGSTISTSGQFNWIADTLGVQSVKVLATDGRKSDSEVFTITVSNPPPTPIPRISINSVSQNEGNQPNITTFIFQVRLQGSNSLPVSVDYTTLDSTALVSDNDYTATSGTLQFSGTEGELQTINISVIGDNKVEPDEIFRIRLSNCNNCQILSTQVTGAIINDDVTPKHCEEDYEDIVAIETSPYNWQVRKAATGQIIWTQNFAQEIRVANDDGSFAIWHNTNNIDVRIMPQNQQLRTLTNAQEFEYKSDGCYIAGRGYNNHLTAFAIETQNLPVTIDYVKENEWRFAGSGCPWIGAKVITNDGFKAVNIDEPSKQVSWTSNPVASFTFNGCSSVTLTFETVWVDPMTIPLP